VLSHELYIPAVAYLKRTPDFDFIDVCPVDAAFDFSTKRTLLKAIEANDHQGFDDTFILDNEKELILTERMSPYIIKFKTTYPAVVIYTHNLRSPAIKDAYPEGGLYAGVAIECQYAPGGIHEPKIKMPLLKKDELYQHMTTLTILKQSTI
jgi:galactose mutarotase-like enzyme